MDTDAARTDGYLGSTPTMADVIGWVFAVPTIMAGLTICPYIEHIVPRYESMFHALGARLPGITIFVLERGWWFFTLLPLAIVIASTALLVRARGPIAKIAVPFVANQLILGIIGTGVLGIVYPILELQKQLS